MLDLLDANVLIDANRDYYPLGRVPEFWDWLIDLSTSQQVKIPMEMFEPRDIFLQFIEERTAPDGADLGAWLMQLFEVLNTPVSRRQRALDEDLARFPHVNGELFADRLRPPAFDTAMRAALLDAGQFDWTAISPAIFGALFQSVMEPAGRRAQGAHYTTEKNILKVIEPLFLDDLRAEFRRQSISRASAGRMCGRRASASWRPTR